MSRNSFGKLEKVIEEINNQEIEKTQLQETKIATLTTEIQEIKQAFQKALELIEIKISEDKNLADKTKQELAALKIQNEILTTTAINAEEELKICLTDKNKAESHCYDQFAGL